MIEQSFIESGFSFTTSKILPFIITFLIGLILMFLVKRKIKFKKTVVKYIVLILVLILPIGIYFIFNPVYEGDFSNNYNSVERTSESAELSGNKLYVISIAGCPYCKEAMPKMLLLKQRTPNLEIEYVVCANDSTALEFYKEVNEGKIPIHLAQNPEKLMMIAEGSFPAFVLSQKDLPLRKWANQDFGVRALDEVESLFTK